MKVDVVDGDLLDQDVEVIVNTWNRNLFPWWLLLPQGVSRAIKRRGGTEPFRQLRGKGLIPLGSAVETSAEACRTKRSSMWLASICCGDPLSGRSANPSATPSHWQMREATARLRFR